MNELLNKLKKNKIQFLKLIITVGDIYFLLCSFVNLTYGFSHNYFMSFTIFYLMYIFIIKLDY